MQATTNILITFEKTAERPSLAYTYEGEHPYTCDGYPYYLSPNPNADQLDEIANDVHKHNNVAFNKYGPQFQMSVHTRTYAQEIPPYGMYPNTTPQPPTIYLHKPNPADPKWTKLLP